MPSLIREPNLEPNNIYNFGGMLGKLPDLSSPERYYLSTPFIVGTPTSSITGTITLPTGLQENDIVFILSVSDTDTQNLPTGYTAGQNGVSNSVQYRWSYKRMGATPDTTATNLQSTSSGHIAFAVRGVSTTTVLDATVPSISTSATTGNPNPPAITTVTNNAMVLAFGFIDDVATAATTTAPSGYTLISAFDASGGGTVMAAQTIKSAAGAEDPGAFTVGSIDTWVGATVALRPSEQVITENDTRSGIWSLNAATKAKNTIFVDGFSTYGGWTTVGTGSAHSVSTTQSYSGYSSLYRSAGTGANGIWKSIGTTLARGTFKISAWIYSAANSRTSGSDVIAIVNSSGNGYGVSVSETSIEISTRSNYALQTAIATSSIARTNLVWYKVELVSNSNNTFTANRYDAAGNLINSVNSSANTTYTSFDRVAILGGNPYYIDSIKVERLYR